MMKVVLNVAVLASLVCLSPWGQMATAGQSATDSASNLLINGDFEKWTDGAADHWTSDSFTTIASADGEGYGAKGQAAILENTGTKTAWFYQCPSEPPRRVPFKEGQHVRFTVWLRLHQDSPAPKGGLSIRAGSVDGPPRQGRTISSNRRMVRAVKDKYTKYEVVHTIQPGAKSFFGTLTAETPVKLYVDGAVMEFTDEGPVPEPIDYITPQIPEIKLPPYQGRSYEAVVPDTLDLQQRAALAVHGLTALTDPESDYEIYWGAYLGRNPPYAFHSWNDSCWNKYAETLPLLRLASGSRENMHVELRWLEVMLHMQGEDGLLYFPKIGKPWWRNQCYGPPPPGEHYALPYCNGRLLGAMTLYYPLTGEQLWKDAGRRVVDGLAELAVDEGDKAYFQWIQYGPGKKFPKADRSTVTHNFASWCAWTVQGLANYYKMTDYEPAKILGGKLTRWILTDSNHFDAEGRFLPEHPGTSQAHFHGHTMVLLALLDYGVVTGDANLVDFVRKGFEFAKGHGNTLVGYFPEWLSGGTAETCEVAEMVDLALKLSQAGAGDYWDDADRWIRNQFAEAQLLNGDWMDERVKQLPVTPAAGPHETTERVSQRIVGCFAPEATANERNRGQGACTVACCTGNGARALYYIWENILTCQDGSLRVNLLLNRASPWADVDSYIPYQGRVDVKVKKECELSVRIPEWVTPNQTQCLLNGKKRPLSFDGRYALVGKVQPEDVATLCFPIFERTDVVEIMGKKYTLVRKGNDVVHIDPPGKYCPLYQREKYRQNKVQTKKVQRFVAHQQIAW